jgi:glycosyltransferase involved in cell wall biosynthesis
MKVLLIARTIAFGGGAEKLVFETYTLLKEKLGAEHVMLVVFQPCSMFSYENVDYYEKILSDDPHFVICDDVVIQLSLLKKNTISNDRLAEIVDAFQPTIIHSHLFIAELYSRTINYPTAKWVTHFHDNMPQFLNFNLKTIFKKRLISNYYEKLVLKRLYKKNKGTVFIAVSSNTFDFVEKHTFKYPVILLENAINLSKFNAPTRTNIETINIINIGSFSKKKNQIFFIEIAKELFKITSNFKITLLGDGPLRMEVEEAIISSDLQDFIEVIGIVPNVANYLKKSNIYVHTATYEPMGLVLVEAMASSLPIVSLNGQGNSHMIENGKNGFMIDEQNPSLFASSILDVFSSREIYEGLSKTAFSYSRKYDIQPYIDKLLAIYFE